MAKFHMIRPLPTGSTPEAKAERSHIQASRWGIPGVPGDGALAGKPYLVDESTARALARSGWVVCDAKGTPTGEAIPAPEKPEIRAGTQEWKDLPPEERFGSEEWRDIQMQKALEAAAEKEAAAQSPATTTATPQTPEQPAPEIESTRKRTPRIPEEV